MIWGLLRLVQLDWGIIQIDQMPRWVITRWAWKTKGLMGIGGAGKSEAVAVLLPSRGGGF